MKLHFLTFLISDAAIAAVVRGESVTAEEQLMFSGRMRRQRNLRVHQELIAPVLDGSLEAFIDPSTNLLGGESMSMPTSAPSAKRRTKRPTPRPTSRPIKTIAPTKQTEAPQSSKPSYLPSSSPTKELTNAPRTKRPRRPRVTPRPTNPPRTNRPTNSPRTKIPTNIVPSAKPVQNPSVSPNRRPSDAPTTGSPSRVPKTGAPMILQPPTSTPSSTPMSALPTRSPSFTPVTQTKRPTSRPTEPPATKRPTMGPGTSRPTLRPTEVPTDQPFRSPTAAATCEIELDTRCEECESLPIINPVCSDTPTQIVMRLEGGTCADSQTPQDFVCFDFGTISRAPGTRVYVMVQFRQTVYFSGFVRVGQDFIIQSPNGGTLGSSQSIVIYRSDDVSPGNVLQSLVYVGDCSEPLRLKSQFGASQVIGFTINGDATNAFEDLTVMQRVRVPTTSASNVELVSLATQSNIRTFNLTDIVAGDDLQIGQATAYNFDITVDLTIPRDYNLVSAVGCNLHELYFCFARRSGHKLLTKLDISMQYRTTTIINL
ncbi:hypothetical protein MPSEU_000780800 [Mayamaea pseudoterrestris]|nr:hypothetical protein MPSEU_000780800 [Mayamaea pseudoterrestris]